MKIIDRLYQYIDFKGVSVSNFERKNGLSTGYLTKMKNRSADIGEGVLNKIIENNPYIALKLLVLGEGDMLKKDENLNTADNTVLKNDENFNTATSDNELIKHFASQIGELNKRIGQLETENKNLQDENNKLKAEVESLKTIHIDFDPQPSNTTTLIEPA